MAAKRDQSPCGKPPDLVSKTPLPKEEQERAKRIRAQGVIAIAISEDGNVVDAKVVRASSTEAGKLLIDVVKGMKFKPRPGCGPFKTVVNFSLAVAE
jgi:TonB family protein